VHEVSRRVLGSSTTPDLAGTRAIAPARVAFCALQGRRRPDCIFSELNTHPTLYPYLRFTESLTVSAQDSGPSGSLPLSREALSSSTSCRFIPAHCNGDVTPAINGDKHTFTGAVVVGDSEVA
jgi:hypothetical protein